MPFCIHHTKALLSFASVLCFFIACTHREPMSPLAHVITQTNTNEPLANQDSLISDTIVRPVAYPIKQYPEKEIMAFLDSVAQLDSKALCQAVIDSTWVDNFGEAFKMDKTLSDNTFAAFKKACLNEKITPLLAQTVFDTVDSSDNLIKQSQDTLSTYFFPLGKNKFDKFAFTIPNSDWANELYFFEKDVCKYRYQFENRYGVNVKHFKAPDGNLIVYWTEGGGGTGEYQFNYYFYKYTNNTLMPILNVVEYSSSYWRTRDFRFETTIVNTNPLVLKFNYRASLLNEDAPEPFDDDRITIINDSINIPYDYDIYLNQYVPKYQNEKMNEALMLSFYYINSELLFINMFHKKLRKMLETGNTHEKQTVLFYLNNVRTGNYYRTGL